MHKIDTPSAVAGNFVDKDSSLGIEGTVVDASWLNSVQDEICNMIEGAGATLNKESVVQLRDAVASFIHGKTLKTVVHASSIKESISATVKRVSESFKITQGCTLDFMSSYKIVSSDGSGALSLQLVNATSGVQYYLLGSVLCSAGAVENYRVVVKVGAGGTLIPNGDYYVTLNAIGNGTFPSNFMFRCEGIVSRGQA